MSTSAVVAMGSNYIIGKDGKLPGWQDQLPADMKHFKDLTVGNNVIMGRNTWESLPARFRPLPDRTNIVLSRQDDFQVAGAIVCFSLTQALLRCTPKRGVFIIGGAQVFEAAFPLTDTIHLTLVHAEFEGDARFPHIDPEVWREVEREDHDPDEKNKFRYSFITLVRR